MVKKLLKNNVTLLVQQMKGCKSASIGFYFTVGSRLEKEGGYGISHFTEHMLFKGTSTLTTHQIACTFDRMGAYVNAFTEREDVCLYSTLPASNKNLKTALGMMCAMASDCTFPQNEFEMERNVVLSEISAVLDDDEESAIDCLAASLWHDGDLGRTITGTAEDVLAITREQMAVWYAKYFVHGELTVAAAGNIDEDILVSELEKLPMHQKPLNYPYECRFEKNNVWHPGVNLVKADFNRVQVFLMFPYKMPLDEKKYYTLSVFNSLAGDTMSSRLFESLREQSGLCYTVYSFFTIYEDEAFWGAYASCEKDKAVQVVQKLLDEIEKLKSSPIQLQEINDSIEHLCGEETLASQDSEYIMKRLERNHLMGFTNWESDAIIKKVASVTHEEIHSLVDELFDYSKRNVLVYGASLNSRQKKEILCLTKETRSK